MILVVGKALETGQFVGADFKVRFWVLGAAQQWDLESLHNQRLRRLLPNFSNIFTFI